MTTKLPRITRDNFDPAVVLESLRKGDLTIGQVERLLEEACHAYQRKHVLQENARTIAAEEGMSEYIFSYYARETTTGIQRRPWWNLFGRDVLVTESVWRHHRFVLPEDEALLLIPGDNPTVRLLYRVIGPDIAGVQLEHNPNATPYIKTRSSVCRGDVHPLKGAQCNVPSVETGVSRASNTPSTSRVVNHHRSIRA